MMTEVCEYLRNWFDKSQPKLEGNFTISDGSISLADGGDMGIKEGQYYRIIGSALNDGVWKYPGGDGTLTLRDETFSGTVWLMAVPPALVAIAEEIDAWQAKYGGTDSAAMSPYTSESFQGYSYTKGAQGSVNGTPATGGWITIFGARLKNWKKLC